MSIIRDSDGTQIAYSLSGPPGAICVALIHGWTGGMHEFEDLVPALNSAGIRTFAMDMPGHCNSGNVEDRSAYTMSALADANHRIMSELGVIPTIVLGFSMGGAIADELAIRHPQDVLGIVALGSAGFDWFDDQAQIEIDEAEPIVFEQGMEAHYDVWKQRTGKADYDRFNQEELTKRRRAWARTSPDAYAGTLYGLRDKRNTLPDLLNLNKPTLIIHGENDEPSIRSTSETAHRAMVTSTYHVVPGAGHFAHEDNPSDFNETLIKFIRSIQTTEPSEFTQKRRLSR